VSVTRDRESIPKLLQTPLARYVPPSHRL